MKSNRTVLVPEFIPSKGKEIFAQDSAMSGDKARTYTQFQESNFFYSLALRKLENSNSDKCNLSKLSTPK